MNLQTMIDRTYDGLRDYNKEFILQAEVISWLNEAQRDLAHRQKILQKETSGTVPVDQEIPLPGDFVAVRTLRFGDRDVRWVDDQEWFEAADTLTANPYQGPIGRLFESGIEVYPKPAVGEAYTLRYIYEPADLPSTGDLTTINSALPVVLHPRMVYYARAMGFLRLNETEQAQHFIELYERGLRPPADGTERVLAGPMRLRYEAGPFDLHPESIHRG